MNSPKTRISIFLRKIGVSVAMSVIAILVAWLLFLTAGTSSLFAVCLLGVILATWYGDQQAGLLTTTITALSIDYLFIPPSYSLLITHFSSLIDLIVFCITGIIATIVIDKIKNTRDILAYKKKEQEYLELLLTLEKQNLQYQKEVKARDEFLSIASHELKTPLSAMLLQIQTALHNIRNVSLANFSVESLLRMLQSTEQQSKRLSKMINDLLNVSLITTGRIELEKEEVDLSELVKDVVERFTEKAEKEGSPIKIHVQEKVIGEWDKLRIEQAVTNLISNAIKYGNSKPIMVEVIKRGAVGELTVNDQGIGIPKDRQEKIFERFERAVSNHHYKGLGVGLYITQQIVKAHHGKMRLDSKPNDGSTFIVELPLKQSSK